jgi:hypothetical protein
MPTIDIPVTADNPQLAPRYASRVEAQTGPTPAEPDARSAVASPSTSGAGAGQGAQHVFCAALAAILTITGCGASNTTGDGPDGLSATTLALTPSTSATTAAAISRSRSDLKMKLDTNRALFTIDGASGAIPQGWEDPHIRAFYVFLGYNTAQQPPQYDWLSVAVPSWTGIQPPGPEPRLEPTPPDILAQLAERSVAVTELGILTIDGVESPVIQVDGHLHVCSRDTLDSCRFNDPTQFYVLVPYRNGELVVEGESNLLSTPGAVTAEKAVPLITALQTWADTIDLP